MANAGFGSMVDWFGFEVPGKIELIRSSSGDTRSSVYASQTGGIANVSECGSQTGGVLRNPSCVYQVVGDVTISATLGKSWAKSGNVSGYMLTSAVVETRINKFPVFTLTATANEGADAINLYAVSIPVIARARPQNLMSAIYGGGELQRFTLSAQCDPVVLCEDLMPCASDVVHGKLVANAETAAYYGESAPSASSGFTEIGTPLSGGDVDYKTWEITAEKGI